MQQTAKKYLKKLWIRRRYYLTLEWIHPFWLRAVVSLLVAIPVFIFCVIGFTAAILLVPLIILVKYVGFSYGVIIWFILYIVAFMQLKKWVARHNRTRPRRRVRR